MDPRSSERIYYLKRAATLLFGRVVLVCIGLGAIGWACLTIGTFTSAAGLDFVSGRILQTEPFQLTLLRNLANATNTPPSTWDRPETLREIAIVNERLLEQELLEGKRTAIDNQIDVTIGAMERAIRVAPADSFLWLSLYWLRTAKSGFSVKNLSLLKMSYHTGPHEGWVATRRNRFAFIVFDYLPADLKEAALAEFVSLIASGYVSQAADIFVGPAWSQRDILMARIENLPITVKQAFARRIYDMGYNMDVPGVPRFGERPWR